MPSKNRNVTLVAIAGLLLIAGLIGLQRQGPRPLQRGVIYRVFWASSAGGPTGMYREKMPETPTLGGSYSVDMYGVLYPTHLEIRFPGRRDGRVQIIPFRQIELLEFGDGGIKVEPER